MPITAAGGIVQGAQDFMGLAKDMRAIQTSEAQADLVKQETAEKTFKLNEMKRQHDLATKPIVFDNFLSSVPNAPGYRDQVKKEMMDAGLVKIAPDGTPYTDQESVDRYHRMVDSSKEQTMSHLSRINVGMSAKIGSMQQEMADEKTKPERKQELQKLLPEAQKNHNEFLQTMLQADEEFTKKEALQASKPRPPRIKTFVDPKNPAQAIDIDVDNHPENVPKGYVDLEVFKAINQKQEKEATIAATAEGKKETSRHNKEMERIGKQGKGRDALAQFETERHNKEMEKIGQQKADTAEKKVDTTAKKKIVGKGSSDFIYDPETGKWTAK